MRGVPVRQHPLHVDHGERWPAQLVGQQGAVESKAVDRAAAVGNLAAHRRVPVDAAEASSQEAVGRWVSPLVPVEPQKAVHVEARGVAGQAEEAFRALAGLVAADALQVVEAREAGEVLQMVADREAEAPEAAEALQAVVGQAVAEALQQVVGQAVAEVPQGEAVLEVAEVLQMDVAREMAVQMDVAEVLVMAGLDVTEAVEMADLDVTEVLQTVC